MSAKERQTESGAALNRSARPSSVPRKGTVIPQSVYVEVFPPVCARILKQLQYLGAWKTTDAELGDRNRVRRGKESQYGEFWCVPLNGKAPLDIERALKCKGWRGKIFRKTGKVFEAAGSGIVNPANNARSRARKVYRELQQTGNIPLLLRELFPPFGRIPEQPDDWDGKSWNCPENWTYEQDFFKLEKLLPQLGAVYNALDHRAFQECGEMMRCLKKAGIDQVRIKGMMRAHRDRIFEKFDAWVKQPRQSDLSGYPKREKKSAGSATEKDSLRAARLDAKHSKAPTTAVDWFPPMALVSDMPVCQRQHETPVCHAKQANQFTDSEALASLRFFFQECLLGQFAVRDSNRFWQSAPCPEGALLAIRLLVHLLLVQQTK